jgi:chromosome segregation ATPase
MGELLVSQADLLVEQEDLKRKNEIYRQKVEDLNTQLRYAEEVNNELARENEVKTSEIDKLVCSNTSHLKTAENLREENELLKKTVDMHRDRVGKCEKDYVSLSSSVEKLQLKLEDVEATKLKQAEIYNNEASQLRKEKLLLQISVEKLTRDLDEEKRSNQRQLEFLFEKNEQVYASQSKPNKRYSNNFDCTNQLRELNLSRPTDGLIDEHESYGSCNNNERNLVPIESNDKNFYMEQFGIETLPVRDGDLNSRGQYIEKFTSILQRVRDEYELLKSGEGQLNSTYVNKCLKSLFEVVLDVLFGADESRVSMIGLINEIVDKKSAVEKKRSTFLRRRLHFYRKYYRSSLNKLVKFKAVRRNGLRDDFKVADEHVNERVSWSVSRKLKKLTVVHQEWSIVALFGLTCLVVYFLTQFVRIFARLVIYAENNIGVRNPFETVPPF